MPWRNRCRVRRRALGRIVAYNIRFAGQVFDGQAGLHQNEFRDYDPAIGRYAESDPMGLAGGSPSPYDYVRSNPVFLIDPTGLADLNLFDPNPHGHDSTGTYAGGNAWNIPGVYTVAGHGNPGWMEDDRSGYRRLYPEDLAKIIKNDPNWRNNPVMLGGCNTGDRWEDGHAARPHWDSFAQTLANLLGVPVTAPLQFTRWNSQQGLIGTSPTIAGPVQYPGQWKTSYPMN
jgi:RHS repeat-associated protein